MTLNENQRLMCVGQMPLRAPDGKQLAAVPVYKIVSADVGAGAVELSEGERLLLVGTEESRETAEERYNALISGGIAPKSQATPLYIKSAAESKSPSTELAESEKRALNPLIADLISEFSAAMQEREALERQGKRG